MAYHILSLAIEIRTGSSYKYDSFNTKKIDQGEALRQLREAQKGSTSDIFSYANRGTEYDSHSWHFVFYRHFLFIIIIMLHILCS
jgi:hypothetical protein